jgi:hypothetical protein
MTRFSNREKLACAERELEIRRRVYPTRVNKGIMKEEHAAEQTALMEAIVEDYKILASWEEDDTAQNKVDLQGSRR